VSALTITPDLDGAIYSPARGCRAALYTALEREDDAHRITDQLHTLLAQDNGGF
jgi:hypothetical protein